MGKLKLIHFPWHTAGKVEKVVVGEGDEVKYHDVLLWVKLPDVMGSKQVRTKYAGEVTRVMVKEGDTVRHADGLVKLHISSHHRHVTGFNDDEDTDASGRSPGELALSVISKMRRSDTRSLLDSNKLALVVDLDHTLVHTTTDGRLARKHRIRDEFTITDHPGSKKVEQYYCKVRPGARGFLRKVAEWFELYVCTHGQRSYALRVVRILDRQGKIFSNRIISRRELGESESKLASLDYLFPSGSHHVCIIDDREDVWDSSANLVLVKRYEYLSNKDGRRDEDRHDRYLDHLLDVLHTLHSHYFLLSPSSSPSLHHIIPDVRSRVLQGVHIVFSNALLHLLPLEEQPLCRLAHSLGASVSLDIEVGKTTHVVAQFDGTRKVIEARSLTSSTDPPISVVSLHWLRCCSDRWERVDEELFPLTLPLPETAASSSSSSSSSLSQTSSSSELADDDDNTECAQNTCDNQESWWTNPNVPWELIKIRF